MLMQKLRLIFDLRLKKMKRRQGIILFYENKSEDIN